MDKFDRLKKILNDEKEYCKTQANDVRVAKREYWTSRASGMSFVLNQIDQIQHEKVDQEVPIQDEILARVQIPGEGNSHLELRLRHLNGEWVIHTFNKLTKGYCYGRYFNNQVGAWNELANRIDSFCV